MTAFNHFNEQGEAIMVNVGHKEITHRVAKAEAVITMLPETLTMIISGTAKKGDVLNVSRIAGIMAAKKTSELIPLCHGLPVESVTIDFEFPAENKLRIITQVEIHAKTGVEMEALTAVSITALTIYDMCKSGDKAMVISSIRLLEKSGGKSGHFQADTKL